MFSIAAGAAVCACAGAAPSATDYLAENITARIDALGELLDDVLDRGYRKGDLSLVYPLARATGPLLKVEEAWMNADPAVASSILTSCSSMVAASDTTLSRVSTASARAIATR